MTAKDKAFELYKMYNNLIVEQVIEMKPSYLLMTHEMAKKSALLAVNLVLNLNDIDREYSYYLEVKKEIEKL